MLGDDSERSNISGLADFAKCLRHARRDTLRMEVLVVCRGTWLVRAGEVRRPGRAQGFPQVGGASVQWKVALKIGNSGGLAVGSLCGCRDGVVRCVHVVSPGI